MTEHNINHHKNFSTEFNSLNGEPIGSIEIMRSRLGIKDDAKKDETAIEITERVPKQTFSDNLAYERDVNDPISSNSYSHQI
jgi:hypothetical protein